MLDPRRDVEVYFETARNHGFRISYAIDTHGHNDYLTGIAEIAQRQDVQLLGFDGAPLGYDHRSVEDGEVIEIGDIGFEVIHTPGHTPEHVSLLVYDRSAGKEPALLLSGGALLVGDIARPDLLGGEDEARAAAAVFCHTLQEKILWQLDDHVEVFPTHVSGSLCGANIGSRLSTTVGYERKTNPVLARISSSDEFVEECIRLDNLPAVPPYWKRMRAQNLAGPALLGVLSEPPALTPAEFEEAASGEYGARDKDWVVDVRSPDAFSAGHVPGAVNVGLSPSFATWAGTLLPGDASVLLVLDDPGDLWETAWQLLRIGYNPPAGWLAGGMNAWRTSGRPMNRLPQLDVHELNGRTGEVAVLDVRQPAEWSAGHIPGATFITGAELPARLDELSDEPLVVMCGGGYRSSVAASLIARSGRSDVSTLAGGMSAWRAAGKPVTR